MSELNKLRQDLRRYSSPAQAKILSKFFKTGPGEYGEGDVFIGVKVPHSRLVAKKYFTLKLKELRKLIRSRVHEERLVALLILVFRFSKGNSTEQKQIFKFYLKHTPYINNWDLVDLTAPNIVGNYLLYRPKTILLRLAKSKDLWERRLAILATFAFIYKGQSIWTFKIARKLLTDKHDLIHKAVGWMLREVGKRVSVKQLCEFLDSNKNIMPRTMLRYAIERLPQKQRQHYLAN